MTDIHGQARRRARTIGGLGLGVALMLTGCFRPAGVDVEPTSDPNAANAFPTALPLDPNAAFITPGVLDLGAPTSAGDTVFALEATPTDLQTTPFVIGATLDTPAEVFTAPTVGVTLDDPFPSLTPTIDEPFATTTDDLPTALPFLNTATQFITPQGPSGPIVPSATLTLSPFEPTSTPSGLITPTALAIETNSECVYVVEGGDSLYGIALEVGVSLLDLRAANPDLDGDNPVLQIGQELQLPACAGTPQPGGDAEPTDGTAATGAPGRTVTVRPTTGPTTTATALPEGYTEYRVRPGDTLYNLAIANGVTVAAIAEASRIGRDSVLQIGQRLIIPPRAE